MYFDSRDWQSVRRFWARCIALGVAPSWATQEADSEFSATPLRAVYEQGYREYNSGVKRLTRAKSFAVSFGYVGSEYHGYQRQPVAPARTRLGPRSIACRTQRQRCHPLAGQVGAPSSRTSTPLLPPVMRKWTTGSG